MSGRQRARFAVASALCCCSCQSALDLDRYDFMRGDAAPGATQVGNTLAPDPSPNDGRLTPGQTPAPGPTLAPSPPIGNGPETTVDASLETPAQPPPVEAQPPPVAPAPTRPVLVSDILVDSGFAGTQEGGERRGICGGGTVMVGVSFYYYPAGAGGALGFAAPICGRFGDDPAAPLEWTRDDTAVFWPVSDVLLGDPPAPFVDQALGELVCPARLVVAGARGNMDPLAPTYVIRDITLECAPVNEVAAGSQVLVDRGGATLIASSLLPISGAEQYSIGCDNGNAAVGLFESTGSWLDGLALSCTSMRRPRIAGDACSGGDACQSGVCDDSGSCAAVAQ